MKSELIIAIIIWVGSLTVSFLAVSGLVWLACWAFAKAFSWKLAIGVWALMFIGRAVISAAKSE